MVTEVRPGSGGNRASGCPKIENGIIIVIITINTPSDIMTYKSTNKLLTCSKASPSISSPAKQTHSSLRRIHSIPPAQCIRRPRSLSSSEALHHSPHHSSIITLSASPSSASPSHCRYSCSAFSPGLFCRNRHASGRILSVLSVFWFEIGGVCRIFNHIVRFGEGFGEGSVIFALPSSFGGCVS